MKEKIVDYAKRMAINAVCYFVVWILLCLILEDEIDWTRSIWQAVVFGILVVPAVDFLNRKK